MGVEFGRGCACRTPRPSRWRRWCSWAKNKDIVLDLNRFGQPAVGLCGDDGALFTVRKQLAGERDIGFVGEIERVDVDVLLHVAQDYIPVVASVGADAVGDSYNVNADAAAAAVAGALGAHKVIFLTDVEGWLADRRPREPHLGGHGRRRSRSSRRGRRRHAPQARGVPRRGGRRRGQRPDNRWMQAALPAAGAVHGRGRGHEDPAVTLTELQALERAHVTPTYARNPLEFVRGEGTRLWDSEGNEYLDFLCGISVTQLGHSHPAVVAAVSEQAGRRCTRGPSSTRSPRCGSPPGWRRHRSAARSSSRTPARRRSSARSSSRAGRGRVARSSWSRALPRSHDGGAVGHPAGGQQAPFAPLVPGFRVVPRDDARALRAAVSERTAAVLLEPIQGESASTRSPERRRAPPRGLRQPRRAARARRIQCGWPHRPPVGVAGDRRGAGRDDHREGPGGGLSIGACVTGPGHGDVLRLATTVHVRRGARGGCGGRRRARRRGGALLPGTW